MCCVWQIYLCVQCDYNKHFSLYSTLKPFEFSFIDVLLDLAWNKFLWIIHFVIYFHLPVTHLSGNLWGWTTIPVLNFHGIYSVQFGFTIIINYPFCNTEYYIHLIRLHFDIFAESAINGARNNIHSLYRVIGIQYE